MISPVNQPESSEARNTTTLAMHRWRTDAAQWRQGEVVLLEITSRAQKPGSPGAFAECGSGVDGVHPDFSRG
jgi:hypothetical protein